MNDHIIGLVNYMSSAVLEFMSHERNVLNDLIKRSEESVARGEELLKNLDGFRDRYIMKQNETSNE